MANVKCPICGETFNRNKEENILLGKRYYHPRCCTSDFIYTERIMDLVRELWGECSRPRIQKQIIQFTRELSCSVEDIYQDLLYFFKIEKGDTTKYRNTIGIVPFIHSKAQRYYSSLRNKEEVKVNIAKQLECLKPIEEKTIYIVKRGKQKRQFELEVEKE